MLQSTDKSTYYVGMRRIPYRVRNELMRMEIERKGRRGQLELLLLRFRLVVYRRKVPQSKEGIEGS